MGYRIDQNFRSGSNLPLVRIGRSRIESSRMSLTNGKLPSATSSKVVVATTVALSFISFWRGASIVLSDLASSAFYAGGIVETAIGPAAPWFVLAVVVFSFAAAFRSIGNVGMFSRAAGFHAVRRGSGVFRRR